MFKLYSRSLGAAFRLVEILITVSGFMALYSYMSGGAVLDIAGLPLQYKVLLGFEVGFWVFLSGIFKLYKSMRTVRFVDEVMDVVYATAICLAAASIPALVYRETQLSTRFIALFWALQTGALVVFRMGLRAFLKYIRMRGYNYKQVLIVGQNRRVDDLVDKIEESPEFGLRILGYVDPDHTKNTNFHISGYDFLGGIENMERIVREKVVDEVFVFLPIKSYYDEIERILNLCENVGVEVEISTDLFVRKVAKSTISNFDDITVISLYSSPRMDWRLVVKRAIDVYVSVVMLVALSPVLAAAAAAIKATSAGPVIFRQKRKGYNGRLFDCLKFRTMVEGAEDMKKGLMALNEMDGPVFKIKDDPRMTSVGRILRKTSIDELPQLVNVLMGEMSLVGPRPPLPDEVVEYELPCLRRLSMKPGLTCLWQVSGRNKVQFERWMELDRDYIDHWSLWLDFKILLKTIPAVFRCTGG